MLTTIVSFFVILLVLILVHEFGHFISAKIFKIKVEEFGIFIPPRIAGFKHGETIYSINALPLGGFVKLSGEEDPKAPGSLAGKSIPVRLITLGAGSLMNLLLPFVLLSLAMILPHLEDSKQLIVQEVIPNSPAAGAGIQVGDTIVSVNGQPISSVEDYSQPVEENLGKEITIVIKHSDDTTSEVVLTPRAQVPEGEGPTGVSITTVITKSYPFWQAIPRGAVYYWDILVAIKDNIVQSIKGVIPFEVSGPVGIAQVVGEVARTGISNLLVLTSLISINLGIVNIFPLPALDGGRIVFVLLEWVRHGKRVSPKTEQLVHTIGFILLLALILLVTYRDITRIISGGSLTS
ncbi:MAG TPA: RIP metalloprotease RseP [Dehalococcoidales bacterium]